MKLQLLPSTFEENGTPSPRQHLTSFILDDSVALDAGSLAMASNALQKENVRDIIISHAHLDHIAGLPLFVDDLFSTVEEPIRIHATQDVIEILERDIFNWAIFPKFSQLTNEFGRVMEYKPFIKNEVFRVKHLTVRAIEVNHKVPACGFFISNGSSSIAMTGDTAQLSGFWEATKDLDNLTAVFIECAFPDDLQELAKDSHHLTPAGLNRELQKPDCPNCPIYIVNIKPMFRATTIEQIVRLNNPQVKILDVGKVYEF